MNVLGISVDSHGSAACLVQAGEIVAAAREEGFPPKKNELSSSAQSIASCLQQAELDAGELDLIAFDTKPLLKFKRILQTYLAFAPSGLGSFIKEMPLWIQQNVWIKKHIAQETGIQGKNIFPEHHEAHAASAFFPSPFQAAAFLTIDGVGEWATTSYGLGVENELTILEEMLFPHSLGLLYSAFSQYLGFKVNAGEDKLMELVPSGEPKYKNLILSRLLDLKEDGSFKLNMAYFDYCAGLIEPNAKFVELFGRPARTAESPLTVMDMDMACSIQAVIEEIVLLMVEHVHLQTGQKKLCLTGGVSMNCVTHGHLLQQSSFDDIWVQPATGDAGAALGAALFAWHQYLGNTRSVISG